MKRFAMIAVALVALVVVIGQAEYASAQQQEVIASWPAFGDSVYLRSDATFKRAMQMLLKKEQAVFSYITTVAGANAMALDGAGSAAIIGPTSTATDVPILTIGTSSSKEGQILYLFNNIASDVGLKGPGVLATMTASVGTAHLFFASGSWRVISNK